MIFEVFNDKGKRVMYTEHTSCIPTKDILNLMFKAGYKFKLDGKTTTIKNLTKN